MTRKQRRLILIGGSLGVLALAAVLVLSALSDSIVFFNSPSDIVVEPLPLTGTVTIAAICEKSDDLETSKRYATPVVPEMAPFVTLNSGLFVDNVPVGATAIGAATRTGWMTLKLETAE